MNTVKTNLEQQSGREIPWNSHFFAGLKLLEGWFLEVLQYKASYPEVIHLAEDLDG